MKVNKIYGFDFEVFSKIKPKPFWCVTFINKDDRNEIITIVDDRDAFIKFYNENIDNIFVGYNSAFYDSVIVQAILNNLNVGEVNDKLIEQGKKPYQILRKCKKYKFINYDCLLKDKSLKQLEGFMGSKIKESSVPFDKNEPLTEEEIKEVIEYNIHDVQETLKVLDNTLGDFEAMLDMVDMFDLDPSDALTRTKASLACDTLGSIQQHTLDDEFEMTIPERLNMPDKYKYIIDWYKNPYNLSYKLPFKTESNSNATRQLETNVAGCDCVYGYGGLHGSLDNEIFEGILVIMDVASLYPSLMINENYSSRKLKDPDKFKQIRDRRLELKKVKDKRQQPLKIVINSTYGILKSRDKACYDPLQSNNVCLAGQLYLTELAGRLENVCKVLQLNTDGIYVLAKSMDDVKVIEDIAHAWEQRTKLELEIDVYPHGKLIQKDVNNYILIKDTTEEVKHYKQKGAYVKKLSKIDYDLPILNKALIDYFVNDIPVEETINNCNELIMFQKIIKLSSAYKQVIYGNSKKVKVGKKDKVIVEDGVELKEKVHRVFASTRESDKGMFKTKVEKGVISYEKVPYTPDKCFIDNEDVNGKTVPDYLDKQYYIDMANDRITQFLTKEESKPNEIPNILFKSMNESNGSFIKFLDNVTNNKITNKQLEPYIKADCCKTYGKTNKLLRFKEVYNLLTGRKSIKLVTLDKQLKDEEVKTIILNNCKFNEKGDSILLDGENIYELLEKVFDQIPNENINPYDIVSSQIDLFKYPTYTNENLNDEIWIVLNWRDAIKPNVILYNLYNGEVVYAKIKEESWKILPLKDGDIIQVHGRDTIYGKKIIGKDENYVNIVEDDISREFSRITQYEILYRK